ncbi:MAG: stage II sporulation protein M [Rhodospirillales bacterium]|nr:stage II sporulation protein M [Rhodospirillales bacterium]
MAETFLKSSLFRKEREQKWRALEKLVDRTEKSGVQSLTSQETLELQSLYQVAISSLSVARSISLDRSVLTYLEALAARAYFCVYGPRSRLLIALWGFFRHDFPSAVRAMKMPIFFSALFVLFGYAAGYALTYNDLDWFHAFVSQQMASGRLPNTSTADLRDGLFTLPQSAREQLSLFASFLFIHNAKIGFLAFALGFAFGIPTALLLFGNGLSLGAFAGLFVSKGLGLEFYGWISIHGTTELFAVILCGGAGLAIGGAVISPGRKTRLASLAQQGRRSGVMVLGAATMFLVAGLLEGFGRQLIVVTMDRYLIGGAAFALWLAYFITCGKRASHASAD